MSVFKLVKTAMFPLFNSYHVLVLEHLFICPNRVSGLDPEINKSVRIFLFERGKVSEFAHDVLSPKWKGLAFC